MHKYPRSSPIFCMFGTKVVSSSNSPEASEESPVVPPRFCPKPFPYEWRRSSFPDLPPNWAMEILKKFIRQVKSQTIWLEGQCCSGTVFPTKLAVPNRQLEKDNWIRQVIFFRRAIQTLCILIICQFYFQFPQMIGFKKISFVKGPRLDFKFGRNINVLRPDAKICGLVV